MITEHQLREELRTHCTGRQMREFCRAHKLDASAVSRMLRRKRSINAETAAALGYEKRTVFVRVK